MINESLMVTIFGQKFFFSFFLDSTVPGKIYVTSSAGAPLLKQPENTYRVPREFQRRTFHTWKRKELSFEVGGSLHSNEQKKTTVLSAWWMELELVSKIHSLKSSEFEASQKMLCVWPSRENRSIQSRIRSQVWSKLAL